MKNWPIFRNAEGRIGRADFWRSWFILAALGGVMNILGLVSPAWWMIFGLPMLAVDYFWACLMLRRLHDLNHGWRTLVILTATTTCVAAFLVNLAPVLAHLAFLPGDIPHDRMWRWVLYHWTQPDRIFAGVMAGPYLAWLWLGTWPGDRLANRFGLSPLQVDLPKVF